MKAMNLAAFSARGRLFMLLCNGIPFLHVAGTVTLLMLPGLTGWQRAAGGAAILYLVPPLAARLIRSTTGVQEGAFPLGGRNFYAWWALANLQMLFCRLPFLEELVRLLPWGYSCWLRLWGAQVGRRVYWSAGTIILDRPFLAIGDDVVFGAGVRINPHVITPDSNGQMELLLATVRIGDRAVIGGYSLLTAGTEIAADECCRTMLVSPPFSKWSNGRRSYKHHRASP